MSQAAPQTSPAPSSRAARTQKRILDSAGHCFAASGYSKTTVEEIAGQAGVSKGIVYHHFRGKEGLLERITEEWIEVSGLEQWVARSESLEQALSGMVHASLDYARNNPLVRGMFQLDPMVVMGIGSSERLRGLVDESRQRMVRAIENGVASGELRDDLAPERMADVVRMLNMALIEHIVDPEWFDASDQHFVDTCLEVLFRGMTGATR
jgi:AcrR family transcriptional regulator